MRRRQTYALLVTTLLVIGLGSAPTHAQNVDSAMAPLYQRLGGLAPISVVVSDLLDVVVPDPILNENPAIAASRDRVPTPYLKYQVTAMVCQASGGPCQYNGRDMKAAHAHLNITEEEWDRFIELFKGILAKHSVPETESGELLAIVASTKADIVVSEQ